MSRTPIRARSHVRAGMLMLAAALVVSFTAIPADAGTAPSISSFSPPSGPVGTSVSINGSDFGGLLSVTFNGTNAPGPVVNGPATQITVNVPSGASTGPIAVSTSNGADQTASNFTVTGSNLPQVNNFNPTSGSVGATVQVYGANFTGATSVRFNGVSASPFTVVGPGHITTTVPSGATTGRISVTTAAGTGTSANNFTVNAGGLTITSFSPGSGSVGTLVTINGTGFSGVTSVKFNGTTASFTVVSTIKITATVPAGATTGKISVTTGAGTTTSGGTFTVTGPHITSFSPTSGFAGTTVSITGTSFTSVSSVKFNGTSASYSVVNSTKISAVVPSGATTGRITVTTSAGTATSTGDFTVTGGGLHPRTISLSLGRGRLFATGNVSVNDGYSACASYVPVVIKRFHRGQWRWVTTTSTGQNGGFRVPIPDHSGRYRAKAAKIQLVNGAICNGDLSNVVRHHRHV